MSKQVADWVNELQSLDTEVSICSISKFLINFVHAWDSNG